MTASRAVLIIEDDEPTQLLLRAIALRNGFEATLATDGEAALELLLTRDFDVVLLDLWLPILHGKNVLRAVAGARPEVLEQIIIVTAARASSYADCEQVALVWGIVRKPFELDVLEHALLECCAKPETDELPAQDAQPRPFPQPRRIH